MDPRIYIHRNRLGQKFFKVRSDSDLADLEAVLAAELARMELDIPASSYAVKQAIGRTPVSYNEDGSTENLTSRVRFHTLHMRREHQQEQERRAEVEAAERERQQFRSLTRVTVNDLLVSVTFPSRPSDTVLSTLKARGFRYDGDTRTWSAAATDANIEYASTLGTPSNPTPEPRSGYVGELWQRCESRGCRTEPVCVNCYHCKRHCVCAPGEIGLLPHPNIDPYGGAE